MLHTYFKTYEVEEPETHVVSILGGGSYAVAALLGSLYVLLKGFGGRFFLALAVDAVFVPLAFLVALPIMAQLGAAEAVIALVIVALGACIARSVPIIAIVENGYRSRGWMVTRG
ncbi:MAG TPA: hypothetical protein VLA02_18835 [Reyranella sp.]|nr:hypothetical protein [Reyranella sp.]